MNVKKLLLVCYLLMAGWLAQAQIDPFAAAVYMDCSQSFCGKFSNITSKDFGTVSGVDLSEQKNAIEPGGGNWKSAMFMKDFGAYNYKSSGLKLQGGEVKTVKTSAANVCKSVLYYRVNNKITGVKGVFDTKDLAWKADCAGNQYQDFKGPCLSGGSDSWQKWQTLNYNIDLTDRNEGSYELEVYFSITGDNNGGSCTDRVDFVNNGGANYAATFTICPNISGSSRLNPTTCGGNGSIILNLQGVADGTYSDRFYYGPVADGTTFSNVVVSGGVATISVPAGTYTNVRYWNTTGCSPIGNLDFTLTDPVIPSAPVSGGNQTVCESSPIQTLTATATVPANHSIKWYDQAVGGAEVTPIWNTVGSKSYFAEAVSDVSTCVSTTRTEVVLTINPAPISPELDPDDQNRTQCEQSPIQTLDANNSIVNVPVGYTVKWYNQASGGAVVASPTLNSVGTITYYAVLVNDITSCESNTSTPVTLTILQAPVKPTLVGGGIGTECVQTPIQTLDARNYVDKPAGFNVIWFDQLIGGNQILTAPTLNSVGTVTYYVALQSETNQCVSNERAAVVLTLNQTPSVPSASTNCDLGFGMAVVTVNSPIGVEYEYSLDGGTFQSNVEFTNVANGSHTITVRNISTGCIANSTSSTFEDIICGCANPTSLSLTSSSANTCLSTPFTISNVEFGGGATQVDITHNGAGILSTTTSNVSPFNVTYTPDATDEGKTITITFKTNDPDGVDPCEASVQSFSLQIDALPTKPVVINGGIQEVCESNPIQTLNANESINIPGGFTLKWYDALIGGNEVTPTRNTVGTSIYYAALVNNTTSCEGSERAAVTLTINPAPKTAVSSGNIIECEQSPIQTLNANSAITPEPGFTVKWYTDAVGGTEVSPILNTVGTKTYYAVYENDLTGCQSNTRTQVDLTINAAPVVPTLDVDDSKRTQCEQSPIQTLDANNSIVNIPAGYTVKWYNALNGGNEVLTPIQNTVGSSTYYAVLVSQTTACESNSRTPVTLTINASPITVEIDADGSNRNQCKQEPIQTLDANLSVINIPVGYTVKWYDTDNNVVLNPTLSAVGSITYFAVLKDDVTGCESLVKTPVTLTIKDSEILVIDDSLKNQNFCNNVSARTVAELQPSGANIRWYSAPTGGTLYNSTDVLTDNTQYYGVLVSPNGCESAVRTPVLVTLACTSDLAVTYTSNALNGCNYIGSTLTFTITATNNGNNEATGVNVNALLPTGYVYNGNHLASTGNYDINTGVWTIGNLPVNSTQTLTIEAAIRAISPGEDNTIYEGNASVSGNEPDSNLLNNTDRIYTIPEDEPNPVFTPNSVKVCQVANLVTTVRVVDGIAGNVIPNATPKVGSQVIFQIFVENAGPSIGKDIELTNTLPAGYTFSDYKFDEETVIGQNLFNPSTGKWSIGELINNGKSAVLYITANVNANGSIGAGDYTEIAAAFGSVFDNDLTNNTARVILNPIPQYDLVMNKTVSNSTPPIESEVTFTLTVNNAGPSNASNVVVADLLPSGFTYRSHTAGQDYDSATGVWSIGDLQANQTRTLDIVVFVKATGDYNNIASVNVSQENEINPADNTDNEEVFPTPKADIKIEKTAPVTKANEHDVVEYTINIVNNGPSDATGVVVTDKLPDNLSYIGHTTGQDYNPATGIWTIGNLANQATATVVIRTVVKDSNETTIKNTATVTPVTFDHEISNNTSEVVLDFEKDCELRIYNYVSANGDGKNDYFIIENIDCYPDNTVEIYNRWGVQVFKTSDYGSDISGKVFTGISDGRITVSQDKTLPEGTYFYVVQYKGTKGSGSKSGYLELTR